MLRADSELTVALGCSGMGLSGRGCDWEFDQGALPGALVGRDGYQVYGGPLPPPAFIREPPFHIM